MESILTSVKQMLGITEDYEPFDQELVIHINTIFGILFQIGVGPHEPYSIKDASNTWNEFIQDNARLEIVKQYMYLRVRLIFDPPSNTSVSDAFKKQADELEWRLNVAVDSSKILDY